jgi:hypothetical protein
LPHVRQTCPGLPWSVHGPNKDGRSPTIAFLWVATFALSFVIPSDCLNCQATGSARLEVEAEDSVPFCPPGRVPHVCAGVAGALHGLNKMGRSPFRCCLLRSAKPKNEKDRNQVVHDENKTKEISIDSPYCATGSQRNRRRRLCVSLIGDTPRRNACWQICATRCGNYKRPRASR